MHANRDVSYKMSFDIRLLAFMQTAKQDLIRESRVVAATLADWRLSCDAAVFLGAA